MAELVDEGKARWIGVSNFDLEQLARCEAVRHVDSVQPPLSLLARGARAGVLPWAAEHGTVARIAEPRPPAVLDVCLRRFETREVLPPALGHPLGREPDEQHRRRRPRRTRERHRRFLEEPVALA